MSIEIKQLHIKSSVVQRAKDGGDDDAEPSEQQAAMKEELLAECKTLILDVLRELQER
jgi:hypothetical protein